MSDDAPSPVRDRPGEPTPERPAPSRLGLAVSVLSLLLLAVGMTWLGWRASRPAPDTPLRFRAQPWPGNGPVTPEGIDGAVAVATARLQGLGIPCRVRAHGSGLEVVVPLAEVTRTHELLAPRGDLRFYLVVDDPGFELEERVLAEEATGANRDDRRYASFPQRDDERRLIVEQATPGGRRLWIAARTASARRDLDGVGRPCVGLTAAPETAKELYRLTSEHVGRRLAIVLDGVVLTAPTVRSAVGKELVIEGGTQGWTEAQLRMLVHALQPGGPLPVQLVAQPAPAPSDE